MNLKDVINVRNICHEYGGGCSLNIAYGDFPCGLICPIYLHVPCP